MNPMTAQEMAGEHEAPEGHGFFVDYGYNKKGRKQHANTMSSIPIILTTPFKFTVIVLYS